MFGNILILQWISSKEVFANVKVTFSPKTTDSKPTEKDLRMLVATNVIDYTALGTMLGLKFKRIRMFKNEQGGDTIQINMEILTTWIEEKTKIPTTWRTLIGALSELNMKQLKDDIIEKLKQGLTWIQVVTLSRTMHTQSFVTFIVLFCLNWNSLFSKQPNKERCTCMVITFKVYNYRKGHNKQ